MLLLFLVCVLGEYSSRIPSTGTPPNRRFLSSAVLDSESNELISFGGYDFSDSAFSTQISSFSLTSHTWKEVISESTLSPSPFQGTYSYLRSDRVVLVFFGENSKGIISDVYSFSLITYSWKVETLIGDPIEGRTNFGFASFNYLGIDYVAIFGGLTHNGLTNDLYL